MSTPGKCHHCSLCGHHFYAQEMVFKSGKPSHVCLGCNRKRVRAWKKNNPKKVVRTTVKYGQRNKEKRRAVSRVKRAARRGDICYPIHCSECGDAGKIHAHHEDYSKPLQVIFLCPQCHSNKHSKRKA